MGEMQIRWLQRLSTFGKALSRLTEVVDLYHGRSLSNLEKDGMIQRFEYTLEAAWKLLKNYAEYQNGEQVMGSRDAIRKAFAMGIIANTNPWFDMVESRNLTSHVYDEDTEADIIDKIITTYYPILQDLFDNLRLRAEAEGV